MNATAIPVRVLQHDDYHEDEDEDEEDGMMMTVMWAFGPFDDVVPDTVVMFTAMAKLSKLKHPSFL